MMLTLLNAVGLQLRSADPSAMKVCFCCTGPIIKDTHSSRSTLYRDSLVVLQQPSVVRVLMMLVCVSKVMQAPRCNQWPGAGDDTKVLRTHPPTPTTTSCMCAGRLATPVAVVGAYPTVMTICCMYPSGSPAAAAVAACRTSCWLCTAAQRLLARLAA
jgi:hypothetical protein